MWPLRTSCGGPVHRHFLSDGPPIFYRHEYVRDAACRRPRTTGPVALRQAAGDPAPLCVGHPRPARPYRGVHADVVDDRRASPAGAGRDAGRAHRGVFGAFALCLLRPFGRDLPVRGGGLGTLPAAGAVFGAGARSAGRHPARRGCRGGPAVVVAGPGGTAGHRAGRRDLLPRPRRSPKQLTLSADADTLKRPKGPWRNWERARMAFWRLRVRSPSAPLGRLATVSQASFASFLIEFNLKTRTAVPKSAVP